MMGSSLRWIVGFLLTWGWGVAVWAVDDVVDPSTLTGKVMCGYQGWFNCEGDGANLGWTHWARRRGQTPGPGNVTVDLWPDVSEYGEDELFTTQFKLADGSTAKVFSSYHRATVSRHFRWMKDYGIDGVFLQRFANGLGKRTMQAHKDAVLSHCRQGIDGQQADMTIRQLQAYLHLNRDWGDTINLEVSRGGKTRELTMAFPEERPN